MSTWASNRSSAASTLRGASGERTAGTAATFWAVVKVSVSTPSTGTPANPATSVATAPSGVRPPVSSTPAMFGPVRLFSPARLASRMSSRSPGVTTRASSDRCSRKCGTRIAATTNRPAGRSAPANRPSAASPPGPSPAPSPRGPNSHVAPSPAATSPTDGRSSRGSSGSSQTGGPPARPARSGARAASSQSAGT